MMSRVPIVRALSISVLGFAVLAACGGNDAPLTSGNGVNDVRAACEIRSKWNRTGNDCSLCESAVVSPRCECEALAAFSGACLEQDNARKSACEESVDTCVYGCDRADCNCVEGCYAQADTCKTASAARDGCIAEACASHCK